MTIDIPVEKRGEEEEGRNEGAAEKKGGEGGESESEFARVRNRTRRLHLRCLPIPSLIHFPHLVLTIPR